MKCGDWSENRPEMIRNHGRLIAPGIRVSSISSVRCYFRDLQNWELIPRRFDPLQAFSTPKNLLSQIGPDPRVIADDVWAKLVWAGLNLVEDDLPLIGDPRLRKLRKHCYPFELVKALAIIWLFTGLRSNEIMRLRVGCIRWQPVDSGHENENRERAPVCFLDVPVNKTGPAFTKPVDRLVGEAVNAREQLRPPQEKLPDTKTGQMVEFLFLYRMNRVGRYYLNKMVIPLLCSKAGVPRADVRGNFTAHRARSTIASQLFNAKEPMSLTDLQQWLGHKTPNTTRFYAQVTPTRLAQSFTDAAYFTRNLRAIEVLIDQNAVRAGLGDRDLWKYYELGHGYCTYDFFDQCPHRMACAKCDFYLPKQSSRAQFLEGKAGLLRMQQQISLRDSEIAAVNDGLAAYEALLTTLTDTPTPAGPTPRQIEAATLVNITMLDKEAQQAPAIRQAEKQH
jgi:integrase